MSAGVQDILIEVSPGETRAAFVDAEGRLVGLQIERMGEESLVGAICRGRVTRIEKATQMAFLDVALPLPGLVVSPASKLVNSVKNNGPDLLDPLAG